MSFCVWLVLQWRNRGSVESSVVNRPHQPEHAVATARLSRCAQIHRDFAVASLPSRNSPDLRSSSLGALARSLNQQDASDFAQSCPS